GQRLASAFLPAVAATCSYGKSRGANRRYLRIEIVVLCRQLAGEQLAGRRSGYLRCQALCHLFAFLTIWSNGPHLRQRSGLSQVRFAVDVFENANEGSSDA